MQKHVAGTDAGLFAQSMIPQGRPVTIVESKMSLVSNATSRKDKRKNKTVNIAATIATPMNNTSRLSAFLIEQLHAWGNHKARVQRIAPTKHASRNSKLYASFSNATAAADHEHASNNLYALVDLRACTVHWRCHSGSRPACPEHVTQLPFQLAAALW